MAKLRIQKSGYVRKAYVRKGGIGVRGTRVKPTSFTIKDRGKPGRGKQIIKAKATGALKQFGYGYSDSDAQRRIALRRIASKVRKGGVMKGEEQRYLGRVGAGAVWFKRTKPLYARRARMDKTYLSKLIKSKSER